MTVSSLRGSPGIAEGTQTTGSGALRAWRKWSPRGLGAFRIPGRTGMGSTKHARLPGLDPLRGGQAQAFIEPQQAGMVPSLGAQKGT